MRIYSRPIAALAALALLALAPGLSGCATNATFLRADGAAPDPRQLQQDASACRDFLPVVGGFFAGAMIGAAEGFGIGAAAGGANIGVIVGAGAGGLIGLVAGAVSSADGGGYERCMAGKGYHHA